MYSFAAKLPAFSKNFKTVQAIRIKLTVKTPERRQWPSSGIFIVNF